MNKVQNGILAGVASGVIALAMITPSQAIDVSVGGISASVDTDNGLGASVGVDQGGTSAGVGASVGGGSVAGVDANASVGGAASVSSSTSVGGSGGVVDSGTTASLGGTGGVNAGVDANIGGGGGGIGVGVGVGIGPGGTGTPGTGTPRAGRPGSTNTGIFSSGNNIGQRALSGMSNQQIAVYRKRCVSILRDPNAWDYALVQMCKALRQAAAR